MALRSVGDVRCASSSITSMELEMHRTPALLSDLVPDFYFFRIWSQKWAHRGPVTSILTNSKFNTSKFKFSNVQITRPGFHFEVPKNIKLRQKQFHMKDTGKSSSRKLRRVIYYLLYRMDPQKTHYKISFSAKMPNIENSDFFLYISPLNSRSTAL